MTTYAWPTGNAKYTPARAALRVLVNARHNASAESGASQTVTRPGSRWGWSVSMAPMANDVRDDFEGFLVGLSGMEHRITTWDWKRPRPRGTINLSGVTVASTVAQWDTSIALAGCGAGTTLLRGDWLAAGGQLFRVAVSGTASGGGAMSVEVRHMARQSIASGSPVTLDRPTALFILAEPNLELPRAPGRVQPAFGFDLVEVFA